jgi:hypothetical protein
MSSGRVVGQDKTFLFKFADFGSSSGRRYEGARIACGFVITSGSRLAQVDLIKRSADLGGRNALS